MHFFFFFEGGIYEVAGMCYVFQSQNPLPLKANLQMDETVKTMKQTHC